MHQRRDRLALEAAREGGKPLVDSLVEADRATDSIRLCVEHLRSQAGEEGPHGPHGKLRRSPGLHTA